MRESLEAHVYRLLTDPAPDEPGLQRLRERLSAFYAHAETYDAFTEGAGYSVDFYEFLRQPLERLLAKQQQVRILELGAGRTRFHEFLATFGEHSSRFVFDAHDITDRNAEYLGKVAGTVHHGYVWELPDTKYDLVFSTYVFEHVLSPSRFLAAVDQRLNPRGYHAIVCPRYDVPGYVCPSLRHLPRTQQAALSLKITMMRVGAAFSGRSLFLVNPDPAVLHGPWFRDADAVHLVSKFDIERWHRKRGYSVIFQPPKANGLRDRLTRGAVTLCVLCRKNPAS